MKQNLIQQQLKKDAQNISSFQSATKEDTQQYDLTSKAFYISRQLLETKYTFSRKTLAHYLLGKPIVLQQKNNEQPPSVLKGYMSPFEYQLIEDMIEAMIDLHVLREDKIILQKRSSSRLFATNKYDWNLFPKIIIKVKQNTRNERSIIGNANQGNSQLEKSKSKSKLSFFLKQKTSLPLNEEKRKQQLNMKNEREKKEEEERKRKQEEQINNERQKVNNQKQKLKRQEQQKVKKKRQKQIYESQLSNFWIKEREKIPQFVCPKNDISILESPNVRKSMREKEQADEKPALDTAGHILQMQMKQLKQLEDQKKNPIKPIVSWSFMKRTLQIQSSQIQNVKKSNLKSKKNKNNLQEFNEQNINLDIIEETNSQKVFDQSEQNNKFMTNKKNERKLNQSHESHKQRPFLKQPIYLKVQIQQSKDLEYCSQSTEVTQTNYKLKNGFNKTKKQRQIFESIRKSQNVFAQNPQQSIFSNSYYCKDRRSTESIPDRNPKKIVKKDERKQQKHEFEPFSFKRKTSNSNIEETISIIKRSASNTQSFEDLGKVFKKSLKQSQKSFEILPDFKQNSKDLDSDFSNTKTIALLKTSKPRNSFQETRRVSYTQTFPKMEIQISSQKVTSPQPVKKNQKISTKDLRPFTQSQGKIKRDSFAEELINDYLRKK